MVRGRFGVPVPTFRRRESTTTETGQITVTEEEKQRAGDSLPAGTQVISQETKPTEAVRRTFSGGGGGGGTTAPAPSTPVTFAPAEAPVPSATAVQESISARDQARDVAIQQQAVTNNIQKTSVDPSKRISFDKSGERVKRPSETGFLTLTTKEVRRGVPSTVFFETRDEPSSQALIRRQILDRVPLTPLIEGQIQTESTIKSNIQNLKTADILTGDLTGVVGVSFDGEGTIISEEEIKEAQRRSSRETTQLLKRRETKDIIKSRFFDVGVGFSKAGIGLAQFGLQTTSFLAQQEVGKPTKRVEFGGVAGRIQEQPTGFGTILGEALVIAPLVSTSVTSSILQRGGGGGTIQILKRTAGGFSPFQIRPTVFGSLEGGKASKVKFDVVSQSFAKGDKTIKLVSGVARGDPSTKLKSIQAIKTTGDTSFGVARTHIASPSLKFESGTFTKVTRFVEVRTFGIGKTAKGGVRFNINDILVSGSGTQAGISRISSRKTVDLLLRGDRGLFQQGAKLKTDIKGVNFRSQFGEPKIIGGITQPTKNVRISKILSGGGRLDTKITQLPKVSLSAKDLSKVRVTGKFETQTSFKISDVRIRGVEIRRSLGDTSVINIGGTTPKPSKKIATVLNKETLLSSQLLTESIPTSTLPPIQKIDTGLTSLSGVQIKSPPKADLKFKLETVTKPKQEITPTDITLQDTTPTTQTDTKFTSRARQTTTQATTPSQKVTLITQPDVSPDTQTIQTPKQMQSQKQKEKQKLRLEQITNIITPPPDITIRSVPPSRTPLRVLSRTQKTKMPKTRGSVSVSVRRRGKFRTIATGLTLPKAIEVGRGRVARTLGATFKIEGAGKQTIPTPKGFRRKVSKKEGEVFIEKRKFRLSREGEKIEIKQAKRSKKKK